MFAPVYGARRAVADEEIDALINGFRIKVSRPDMPDPAILSPPFRGFYRLSIAAGLPRQVVRYIKLHEAAHVAAGDIDESTVMQFDGPMPASEDAADLVALLGIIDPVHDEHGAEWLEEEIRRSVPLEDRGWQKYRIPRLAKKLPRVRELVRDLHGYY